MRQPLLKRRGLAFPGGLRPGFDPNHIAAIGTLFTGVSSGNGSFVDLLNPKPPSVNNAPTAAVHGTIGQYLKPNAGLTSFVDWPSGTLMPSGTYSEVTFGGIVITAASLATEAEFMTLGTFAVGSPYTLGTSSGAVFTLLKRGVATISSAITALANTAYFIAISSSVANNNVNFVVVNLRTGKVQTDTQADASVPGSADGGFTIGNGGANSMAAAAGMFSQVYTPMRTLLQWAADPWSFWYPTKTSAPEQAVSNTRISNWSAGTNLGTATDTSLGVSNIAVTTSATASVGDLVVVVANEDNASGIGHTVGGSVTDSQGNTYTKADSKGLNNLPNSNGIGTIFYSVLTTALTSGVDTITYTLEHSGNDVSMSVASWTNSAGTIALDLNTTPTSGTTATPSITSGTPTQIGELFVGAVCGLGSNASAKEPPGFQIPPNSLTAAPLIFGGQLQDVATNVQTYNPTGGTAGAWAAFLLSFKFTAAGGDVLQAQIWM